MIFSDWYNSYVELDKKYPALSVIIIITILIIFIAGVVGIIALVENAKTKKRIQDYRGPDPSKQ